MGKERNLIVIFGIIMAFILGSLVSGPFATAQMGTPFLQDEIDAIEAIIAGMQDKLNNIRVAWENVTHVPLGFTNETFTGGIFQGNTSANAEPCQPGDVVTWNGNQWVCAGIDTGLAPNVVVLHYEQKALVEVPQEIIFPELIEFAVWEIVRDPTFSENAGKMKTVLFDSTVYGQVRQISSSTSPSAVTGWFKSEDVTFSTTGMNWSELDTIQISSRTRCCIGTFDSTIFFGDLEIEGRSTSFRSDINFIAFGTRNDFLGSPAGEVKEFSGTMTIHSPPGQSINKICCPP